MSEPTSALPADDSTRELTVVDRDHPAGGWLSLAGDTYSMLVTGAQTAGRYCLIDMLIPDGGGPPPHRHDFEEMFTIIEGSIEFTFRGQTHTARAGSTVNIPANAPHNFRNTSGVPARMLCMCTPAGQDDFFAHVGDPVDGPTAAPPQLSTQEQQQRQQTAARLAPDYHTEMLLD
jgi:quercetin dioxygenase-like cupin family protein